MTMFIVTFCALMVIVIAMAVGVILSNKPIKGSCGGMAALGIDSKCDICGGDTKKCEEEQERVAKEEASSLAYDATSSKK